MGVTVAREVQTTAFLAAACRAAETARPRPRLRDPLAQRFLDAQPPDAAFRRELAGAGDEAVQRTVLLDAMTRQAVDALESPTLINLGAGLCTRPYRLDLSGCALTVECDAAPALELKDRLLADQTPSCPVRRVAVDVRDAQALSTLLDEQRATSRHTVVIAEGLLVYLPQRQVAELAAVLAASLPEQSRWLADVVSSRSAAGMQQLARQSGAELSLYGLDDLDGVQAHGWEAVDYRILPTPTRYPAVSTGAGSSRAVVDGAVAFALRS